MVVESSTLVAVSYQLVAMGQLGAMHHSPTHVRPPARGKLGVVGVEEGLLVHGVLHGCAEGRCAGVCGGCGAAGSPSLRRGRGVGPRHGGWGWGARQRAGAYPSQHSTFFASGVLEGSGR